MVYLQRLLGVQLNREDALKLTQWQPAIDNGHSFTGAQGKVLAV